MNISTTLDKAVRLFPDRVGVVDGERRLTYRQVTERVGRLAAGLADSGLRAGDRISVVAPNSLEFLECYYASSFLGLIVNPINVRLSGSEIANIMRDAGGRLIVAHERYRDTVLKALKQIDCVEAAVWIADETPPTEGIKGFTYEAFLAEKRDEFTRPPSLPDDAPAHLYYTSGTTGSPKGVVLTHRNVTSHAIAGVAEFNLNDADVWLHVAPMFHLADAWATFAITLAGGTHVMLPEFDTESALGLIEKHHVTISNLIPTMLNNMVNHSAATSYDYSSLRVILSGGAPIAPETVRRILETFGCDYIQTYGLTETSPYCTVSTLKSHLKELPEEERRRVIARTGREFLPVELRVVGADGRDVPRDDKTVGEIWVRGDTVFSGYWNKPDETRAAFEEGWFKTGDLAVIDAEGYVNIVDRKKDMIITGGENVYSNEVEYVLYEHSAVLECAVIGVPDSYWGESVKAVVVKKADQEVTEQELILFVKDRLARYKAPKSVDFVKEIPKTGSGKIQKSELKKNYWGDSEKKVH